MHAFVVGAHNDLAKTLALASDGSGASTFTQDRLESTDAIFDWMRAGQIAARVVMTI